MLDSVILRSQKPHKDAHSDLDSLLMEWQRRRSYPEITVGILASTNCLASGKDTCFSTWTRSISFFNRAIFTDEARGPLQLETAWVPHINLQLIFCNLCIFFILFFCQAHHCGEKHSSIVTVFLSLMHSHVFEFLFLTCTFCTIIIIIIIITIIKHLELIFKYFSFFVHTYTHFCFCFFVC